MQEQPASEPKSNYCDKPGGLHNGSGVLAGLDDDLDDWRLLSAAHAAERDNHNEPAQAIVEQQTQLPPIPAGCFMSATVISSNKIKGHNDQAKRLEDFLYPKPPLANNSSSDLTEVICRKPQSNVLDKPAIRRRTTIFQAPRMRNSNLAMQGYSKPTTGASTNVLRVHKGLEVGFRY